MRTPDVRKPPRKRSAGVCGSVLAANALIDTGAILALLDRTDRWHPICVDTFKQLRLPLLTSEGVLTELFHLVGGNRKQMDGVWKFLRSGALELAPIAYSELPHIHVLLSRYWDRRMDFADATLARFDVLAKGAQNATKAELFLMIQPLLVDRFKLKLHRETRELPYYELLVAKNGSKLDKAEEGHCAAALKAAKPCGNMLEFTNGLVADNLTLPAIPRALGRILEDRPVIDKPGLAGTFDIHVMWKRADRKGAESEQERPAVDEVPDSVFVALQEQAGLRLAAAKGPVQVLVIDSVEKPSAN